MRGLNRREVAMVESGETKHSVVTWRKSSFSAYNGNCVEIADLGVDAIGVRDSKAGLQGPVLRFSQADWTSFLAGIKRNQA
jgi:hypothetical protein